jgi:hypothetical protein
VADTPKRPDGGSPPLDDGTRYLGSGLIRSGDQGMLVRDAGRGLEWLMISLVRGAQYAYDGIRRVTSGHGRS